MGEHIDDQDTAELEIESPPGPWRLEIGSADGHHCVVLREGQRVVLGSSAGSGVILEDRSVSARHCEVIGMPRGVKVVDLGSKNGLYVGGAKVRDATLGGLGGSFVVGATTVTVRPAGSARQSDSAVPGLVGSSEAMRRVKRAIRRYARLRAPVLIVGESGTGKDLVARALHELGTRSGQYVPLNVAALPDSLLDAELFGHRRGAFTGAVAHRAGAFEQANRGTLFLDEVAEMSAAAQAKLLRVVEDGMLRPVGAERPTRVEVRIVSATWANLPARIEEDRFRGDLFHRLSTLVVELPPLRRRASDIPALARTLLDRIAEDVGAKSLSPAALAALVAHRWPGNVRQLQGVLYRAAAECEGEVLEPAHLHLPAPERPRRSVKLTVQDAASYVERYGTVSAAARAAGLPRTTFRALLRRSA